MVVLVSYLRDWNMASVNKKSNDILMNTYHGNLAERVKVKSCMVQA